MTEKTTACKKCRRAVYVTDVDAGGYCVFCALPRPEPASKPKDVDAGKETERGDDAVRRS